MNEKEIKKILDKGGVLAQIAFEVIGNPKEHVEESIRTYLANIKKDETIHIINEEIGEAEPVEGDLFSTYADTEILFETKEKLVWIAINFMPASIEIVAPEETSITDKEWTHWLNDLLAKLHEVSITVRQTQTNNDALAQSMGALIQNSIALVLENYHELDEIGNKLGIPPEQIKPFLDQLVKKNKIAHKDGKYYKHA